MCRMPERVRNFLPRTEMVVKERWFSQKDIYVLFASKLLKRARDFHSSQFLLADIYFILMIYL